MLIFQQAGAAGGYLLEHLLLESIGAVRGGGIFAWATTFGAQTLIQDELFQDFLKHGNFRLLVGTDSITNPAAVTTLTELATKNPRLEVRAFLNPRTELFHPKMCWFEHPTHLSVILGSGNLTLGGLRSNWEAFTVSQLQGKDAERALNSIEEFLTENANGILPISDSRVLERVQKNTGDERTIRRSVASTPNKPEVFSSAEDILVAEIPKAGNRWSQANFNREVYEGFFGAKVGTQRRIILQYVDDAGTLDEVESRPSVEVASDNYRFELAAAKGIAYPDDGRPIGVFVRLSTGQFLYTLALPGDSAYGPLIQLLDARWSGPKRQVRRIQVSAEQLQAAWVNSPIWEAAMPAL